MAPKRIRPWDVCEDVEELREMLEGQQEKIEKLEKDLTRASKAASGVLSPDKLRQHAQKLTVSIRQQVLAQMVYKPSARTGSARVSAEIPNVTEQIIKAILGDDLFAAASNGPKQILLKASDDDLEHIFHQGPFSKGLRYGATLELQEGLKFVFEKANEYKTMK